MKLRVLSPVFLFMAICLIVSPTYAIEYSDYLHWNWSTINTDDISFPKDFIFGVGTSAFQVEGNALCTSYTDAAYQARLLQERKEACDSCRENKPCFAELCAYQWTKKNIESYEPLNHACDHWHRYKDDIALMQAMGMKAYRFSIDWSKVEPRPGEFDHDVMHHYADVCVTLLSHGIKPLIGLHHYADPSWFMALGGFEKEENNVYFVRFCEQIFNVLQSACCKELMAHGREALMPLWLTFNSPASYAVGGYLQGSRPPYVRDMQCMVEVLKNMLDAHVLVYEALKQSIAVQDSMMEVMIGITHNIYQLDPWDWYNPVHRLKCSIGNDLVHDSIYRFFTTGSFYLWIPGHARVKHYNEQAPHALDFIALNYYGHAYLGTTGGAFVSPQSVQHEDDPRYNEIPTAMTRYTIYAEGLYRAIHELHDAVARPLGIPLYVTENGISAGDDHEKRDLFLRRSLFALSQAIRDGCDVRGYIHWSFMDNYEWGTYDHKFGLCAVDKITNARALRPGAQYFVDVAQKQASAV